MSLNYEVTQYKTNRINELAKQYNATKYGYYIPYYSSYRSILSSSGTNIIKNSKILALNTAYANAVAQLTTNYNTGVSKINAFKVAPIKITNKKALLIGINNYAGNNKLNGCVNDVTDVEAKLLTMGYNKNNITTLLNENATGANIISSLTSLLANATSGDLLFFQFSGHGSYELDKNGDETDTNSDQDIVGVDLTFISDDTLKSIINANLKPGVTLFALFDSCFSGSILDLRYKYMDSMMGNNIYSENLNESETAGNVIMISGCDDMQTSTDAFINKKYEGAMTWAFLKTLNAASNKITWRKLILNMRDTLTTNGFLIQTPQISSGNIMELDAQVFI